MRHLQRGCAWAVCSITWLQLSLSVCPSLYLSLSLSLSLSLCLSLCLSLSLSLSLGLSTLCARQVAHLLHVVR